MLRLTKSLPVVAIILGITPTAHAETAMEFAFAHFNESAESHGDILTQSEGSQAATLWVHRSAMSASSMDASIRRLNETADTPSELIGINGVTILNGTHSPRAAEIFQRIADED